MGDEQQRCESQMDIQVPNQLGPTVCIPGLNGAIVKRQKLGAVYLITDDLGMFKIGRSQNVAKRLAALQTANSRKLVVFMIFEMVAWQCKSVEEMLHNEFRASRRQGEWFALSERNTDWLIGLTVEDIIGLADMFNSRRSLLKRI